MQGRLAEAIELCETAVECARLSDNPHYLFWALFELGFAHYHLGDLDEVIGLRGERARRRADGGGTMPARGGGPAWVLASALFELGELDRGFEYLPTWAVRSSPPRSRSSAATTSSRWRWPSSPAAGRRGRGLRAPGRGARGPLDLHLPRGAGTPGPGGDAAPAGDAAAAAEQAALAAEGCADGRAAAAPSPAACAAGAGRRRPTATRPCRCCARPSATRRVRLAPRAGTRRGASCASSAPARAARHGDQRGHGGRGADQARAGIAELVTDRKTKRRSPPSCS